MSLAFTYPSACGSAFCRQKFDVKIQDHIRNLYKEFTLTITFVDGRKVDAALVFCFFGPIRAGT